MPDRPPPDRTRLDRVVIVDWSGRASPSPARESRDAIWIGIADSAGVRASYHRTRAAAEAMLDLLLAQDCAQLVGFDFPMGYPAGVARLCGQDGARGLHALLAGLIADAADNANNRFAVAADLNRRLALPSAPLPQPLPTGGRGGAFAHPVHAAGNRALPSPPVGEGEGGGAFGAITGPFWGRPKLRDITALSPCKPARFHVPEKRQVETLIPGAKTVWQLLGAGSVGSQALLGIPVVHRLALRHGAAVWPFDPPGRLTLAEVYPSLLAPAVRASGDPVPDRAQVTLLARALYALARADRLAPLFQVPPVAREEGWILGQGHADALAQALTW